MFGACPELVKLANEGEENKVTDGWKVYQWRQNVIDNTAKLELELYIKSKLFVKKKIEA